MAKPKRPVRKRTRADEPPPPLKTGSQIAGRSPGAYSGSEPKAADMYQPQRTVTKTVTMNSTPVKVTPTPKPRPNLNPLKPIIDTLLQKKKPPKKPKK